MFPEEFQQFFYLLTTSFLVYLNWYERKRSHYDRIEFLFAGYACCVCGIYTSCMQNNECQIANSWWNRSRLDKIPLIKIMSG